jgi:cyclophilin family peptidyl-prolyl cis-trans isomerase
MESQPSKTTLAFGIILFILVIIGIVMILKKPTAPSDKIIQDELSAIDLNSAPTDQPMPELSEPNQPVTNAGKTSTSMHQATLTTNLGSLIIQLTPETAPTTVANFEKLANEGFYNGVRFHRVIQDFMIQTGDPNSKDLNKKSLWGTGGPGYKFADELSGSETYPQGTVAMANAGLNTNGSQFFIVTASPFAPLPPSYTVFGKVISGMDVALKIEGVKTEAPDRPIEEVIIEKITIE